MHYVLGIYSSVKSCELAAGLLTGRGISRLDVIEIKRPGAVAKQIWDGRSLFDAIAVGAAFGMLLGIIYGSQIFIGTIATGLAGFLAGGTAGYLIDSRFFSHPKHHPWEFLLLIRCSSRSMVSQVEELLSETNVLGITGFQDRLTGVE